MLDKTFGDYFSYTPLIGAVGFTGLDIYQDLQANRKASAKAAKGPSEHSGRQKIASAIANAAKVVKDGEINSRQKILQALGGTVSLSTEGGLNHLGFAWAASVLSPASGLDKDRMHASLFAVQELLNKTKSELATVTVGESNHIRASFAREFSQHIARLKSNQADVFWKAYQRLNLYNRKETPSMLNRSNDIWDQIGEEKDWKLLQEGVYFRTHGDFLRHAGTSSGVGQAMRFPSQVKAEALALHDKRVMGLFRSMFGKEGIGKARFIEDPIVWLVTQGQDQYYQMEFITRKNQQEPYRLTLPVAKSSRVGTPRNHVMMTLGSIRGAKTVGLKRQMGDLVLDILRGKKNRSHLNEFYADVLYRRAQFEPSIPSAGQALRRTFHQNVVWDQNYQQGYGINNLEEFMRGNTDLELYSPGIISKGGLLNVRKFKAYGQEWDLTKMFHQSESFDRGGRMWQIVRDLSYVGDVDPKELIPGTNIKRFVPFHATDQYKKFFIEQAKYYSPQALTFTPNRDTRAFRRLGIGEGEYLRSEHFMGSMNYGMTQGYTVSTAPGTPLPPLLPPSLMSNDPHEYVARLNERIKNGGTINVRGETHTLTKGPIPLERGQLLGLDPSGRTVVTHSQNNVTERVLGATLHSNNTIVFDVEHTVSGLNATLKSFAGLGGVKGTLKPSNVGKALDVLTGLSGRVVRGIEGINWDTGATKDKAELAIQMLSAFQHVLHQEAAQMKPFTPIRDLAENLASVRRSFALAREAHLQAKLEHKKALSSFMPEFYRERRKFISQQERKNPLSRTLDWYLNRTFGNTELDIPRTSQEEKEYYRARAKKLKKSRQLEHMKVLSSQAKDTRRKMLEAQELLNMVQGITNKAMKEVRSNLDPEIRRRKRLKQAKKVFGNIWDTIGKARNVPRAIMKKVQEIGLSHELTPYIFGAYYQTLKPNSPEMKELETFATKQGKGFLTRMKEGYIGVVSHYIGDAPHLAQGKSGSLERRNLDALLSSSNIFGSKMLQEAIIKDLYTGIADPQTVKDFVGIQDLYKSLLHKQAGGNLPLVKALENPLLDITNTDWFRSQGARVVIPEEYHAAFKAVGLSPEINIPGMASIGPLAGIDAAEKAAADEHLTKQLSRSGHARIATEELTPQDYAKKIRDLFRLFLPDSKTTPEEAAALFKSTVVDMYGNASDRLIKGKLGPGSSYAYARSIGSVADLADYRKWEEGIAHANFTSEQLNFFSERRLNYVQALQDGNFDASVHGKEFIEKFGKSISGIGAAQIKPDEDTVLISRKLAARLLGEVEETLPQGMTLEKLFGGTTNQQGTFIPVFSKERFLKGEQAWWGIIGRMPGVYQTSLQPTKFKVYQGAQSATEEVIKVQDRLVHMKTNLDQVGRMMNLGIGPGMVLDFDGDRNFLKLFMNPETVNAISTLDMEKYRSEYMFGEAFQQELNTRFKANLDVFAKTLPGMKVNWDNLAEEDLEKQIRSAQKMFLGKDVGKVSKGLEELKFALRTDKTIGDDVRSNLLRVFSAIEEPVSLKAKKLPFAYAASQAIVESLYEGSNMNPKAFMGTIDRMLMLDEQGRDVLGEGLDITLNNGRDLGTRRYQFGKAEKDAFFKAMYSYIQDEGGIRRQVFNATRTNRTMSAEAKVAAFDYVEKNFDAFEGDVVRALSAFQKERGTELSEDLLDALNEATKAAGKHWSTVERGLERNKKMLLGGIIGTSVLSSLFGSSYSTEPLYDHDTSPELLEKIEEGSLLRAAQNRQNIDAESLQGPGGPEANPQLVSPTARITSNDSSTRMNSKGDYSRTNIDTALERWRARTPNGSSSVTIRDNRRPLYPTQFDHE